LNQNLMQILHPFQTLDPTGMVMDGIDLHKELLHYILASKRRDNEFAVGTTYADIWGFYQTADTLHPYRLNPAIPVSTIMVTPKLAKRSLSRFYEQYGEVLLT